VAVLGVHHVAFVVRMENLERVAQRWTEVLGLSFDEVDSEEDGLRVLIDMTAGIELIAPHGPTGRFGPFYTRYLEEHGEGFQAVVLKVEDLGAAESRAVAAGQRVLPPVRLKGDEPYADRFERYVELPLAPVLGTHVVVADIAEKEPASS
jgi:methylmalonyl-CoA/ethylmalonyl-CoA epimerase